MTACRRLHYSEAIARARVARTIAKDAEVGLVTTGRATECDETGAWHVETHTSWKDEA